MKHVLIILALVIFTASSPASMILQNPSFEDADMSAWARTAITGIRPWGRASASPQNGNWYVFAPDEASISQSFEPIHGGEVGQFTFWIDRPATSNLILELTYADGASSGQLSLDNSTGSGWGLFDAKPLIDPSRSLNGFTVTKLGTGSARLDNFHLSMVPEPMTSAFLILAAVLILGCKWSN